MSWDGHYVIFDGETPVLEHWRVWKTLPLPLLSGPLSPEEVVPLRASFMDQIGLNRKSPWCNG